MILQLCMVYRIRQSMKVHGWFWMRSTNALPYVSLFPRRIMSNALLHVSLLKSHQQDLVVVLEQSMEFLSGLKSQLFKTVK
mmetsp:Transcript_25023/g.72184  ORF Transcript_25023/g.72184 Transcript_25023/m.72184 type:complete len:81 (-) Transcript_25023:114-356(-)